MSFSQDSLSQKTQVKNILSLKKMALQGLELMSVGICPHTNMG